MSTSAEDNASSSSLSPFDHPDADIIIRSADGGEFRVFKIDLTRASPVFKDLLSIPQPPPAAHPEDYKDGLPIVPLSEPSNVLKVLLQWCMPGVHHLPLSETVVALVEACRKYDMEAFLEICHASLLKEVESQPLRIYALACRCDFEHVARQAALLCLRLPVKQLIANPDNGLDIICGETFRLLMHYRLQCSEAAIRYISDWHNMSSPESTWQLKCTNCSPSLLRLDRWGHCRYIHSWWDAYLSKLKSELEDCAWEDAVSTVDAISFATSGLFTSNPCSTHLTTRNVASELSVFLDKVRVGLMTTVSGVTLKYRSPRA